MSRIILPRRATVAGLAATLAAPRPGRAQPVQRTVDSPVQRTVDSPVQRTVRILAGFPPGGQIDAVARLLAEALRGRYAASVVVENRPGASGRLVLEVARTAEPDGTTLTLTPSDHLVHFGHLYGNRLRYDPFGDFTLAATLCDFHMAFASGPATPANSLAEFIAWAKDRPSVPFGIPGPGTLPHYLGILFGKAAGLPMQAVAYRGDGPSVQDLLGGQIPLSIATLASLVPLAGSTPLRVLAVGMPQRAPPLPAVQTVGEAGFPDLAIGGWQGVVVPSRTPAPLIAALDHAIAEAMAQPMLRDGIARLGLVPQHAGPAAAAARLARENAAWKPIVANSGFSPDD